MGWQVYSTEQFLFAPLRSSSQNISGRAGVSTKHETLSEDHPVVLNAFERRRRYGCATFDPTATCSPDQASEAQSS
jgi:hypothetical protein